MKKQLCIVFAAGLALLTLAGCNPRTSEQVKHPSHSSSATPSTSSQAPQDTTFPLTFTSGYVYQTGNDAVFYYGTALNGITNKRQFEAFFADGQSVSESPYPHRDPRIKLAAYRLAKSATSPGAFAKVESLVVTVPHKQHAISYRAMLDLKDVSGIPEASVKSLVVTALP